MIFYNIFIKQIINKKLVMILQNDNNFIKTIKK